MRQVLRERLEAAKSACAIKEYNIEKVGALPRPLVAARRTGCLCAD